MEDKNILNNLIIKQFNESNAIAYNKRFLASTSDYGYNILEHAYKGTGKLYARLKMDIQQKTCTDPSCEYEYKEIKRLDAAPQITVDFLQNLMAELEVVETQNFDVNNNYEYTIANNIMTSKAGFSKTDGYYVGLTLNQDSSQTIVFDGPMFEYPLAINSTALTALIKSNTDLIAETPDIQAEMQTLLTKVGLFTQDQIIEGELSPMATISDEFVIKNPDGSYDYEIIDIGGGKGRNILKFDLDKIKTKAEPFINAEVAGLLSSEQEAIAAWNVYISKGTSVDEDDQMVQNANAGSSSWSYEKDLPLSQDKKIKFEKKYKDYFLNNYVTPFLTNRFPTVEEDAAVFDLAEAKKAKAQKFIDDNNL